MLISLTSSFEQYEHIETSKMVSLMQEHIDNCYNIGDKAFVKKIFNAHNKVNQKYDKYDYSYHLLMSLYFGYKYSYLDKNYGIIIKAIIAHDTLEDTHLTYNDLINLFHSKTDFINKHIVEIVYAVTNEKGRNRKERANKKYYNGIKKIKGATFVKLCDRLANSYYSKEQKSSMYNKYAKETIDFSLSLGYHKNNTLYPMYDELFNIVNIKFKFKDLSFRQKIKYLYNYLFIL